MQTANVTSIEHKIISIRTAFTYSFVVFVQFLSLHFFFGFCFSKGHIFILLFTFEFAVVLEVVVDSKLSRIVMAYYGIYIPMEKRILVTEDGKC